VSEAAILGIVVIGRNEGERLVRCLHSLAGAGAPVVYVDSDSTDGSFEKAELLGAHAVRLDLSMPFTAARARNLGVWTALERHPELRYVQFVDGDCEIVPKWIPAALTFMSTHPDVAVVCGRRRERHPDTSIYNLLCDIEWDTPIGATKACGGDAMMRVDAFQRVGGFRDSLIAGEEPELCVRLRADGWGIYRLDEEMTLHDAAMTRFSQWWRRSMRAGYAFAEGAYLHGAPPERHWVRESRRSLAWGAALPFVIVIATLVFGRAALLLALAYPAQVIRLALRERGPIRSRGSRAALMVIGKFAEAAGQLKFLLYSRRGGHAHVIEYK
jgi:GT2 family glycosyltransferase